MSVLICHGTETVAFSNWEIPKERAVSPNQPTSLSIAGPYRHSQLSLVAQVVKNPPAMQETLG